MADTSDREGGSGSEVVRASSRAAGSEPQAEPGSEAKSAAESSSSIQVERDTDTSPPRKTAKKAQTMDDENDIATKSFYDALKVGVGATPTQIRKAFNREASAHHPANGGDAARFKYLSAVCDILLDKKKRAQYDSQGKKPFEKLFKQQCNRDKHGSAAPDSQHLPGLRVLMAPVSDMLVKMAHDEAWARQKWERGAGGYRFDVLAAIFLKRVDAAGRTADSGERESKDVYRLGNGGPVSWRRSEPVG